MSSILLDKKVSERKNAWCSIREFIKFVWPTKKECSLQLRLVCCLLIIIIGRVINLYIPISYKNIVDSIESGEYRWDLVAYYVTLKFLQRGATGGIGLLNNVRSYLWMRVQQHISLEAELKLFRHLHNLDLHWHVARKTGEVIRVMDRGTDSIGKLLDSLLFSIAPTILDIVVAVMLFVQVFSVWLGFTVFTTIVLYISVTIIVTEWRANFQRRKNAADDARKVRCTDSLLNFETVKYCGTEAHEVNSYREAIIKYQDEEWKSMMTLTLLNFLRNLIVTLGLLVSSLLCLHMVVNDEKNFTTGDYVLFASSIVQLYVPLNWFGTQYGDIQKNFVDLEKMFDLLRESRQIIDKPNAKPLIVKEGQVEFSNVSFSYSPEKSVLRNVSFVVPPGKTVALVGPSGAGKSTIVRLLLRLYDVNDGAIVIDQQDIKAVKQNSLRKSIGVVPQNTMLFNDTIKYNIRYDKFGASDDEIEVAARRADIDERIFTFPDGYETQVGERGSRLSDGEKQRVVIARMMLKAPRIITLDEATSALDSRTERNVQEALERDYANRTTIVIAHRLSTIIHADEILILKQGEIVERGRHKDLITRAGVYRDMWEAQLRHECNVKLIE